MKALKRYQCFLLALAVATVAAAFILNTWVNPLRVTPALWTSDSFEEYRAIDNKWNRTAKAGLASSKAWDAAMFGSSRVDIAFDPEHRLFEGINCVNLGLNAGNIPENHAIFSYFMDHNHPRLIIFTIDAGDLTMPSAEFNPTDFSLSPLNSEADPVERNLRYCFGISTLAASVEAMERRIQGRLADHTPQGFRRVAQFPETPRKLIAGLYLATTTRMAQKRTRYARLNPEKLELLDDIIDRCKEKEARLIFLFTPSHGLFQLAFEELGDPDPVFASERRALADRASDGVEVWDFLDAHPVNTEPLPPADQPSEHFHHWLDLFHSTPEIGDTMLDRISGEPGDYGARLTPETIDARIEKVSAGLEAYRDQASDDVKFLIKALERHRSEP